MSKTALALSISERELAATVEAALELYNWLWTHYTFSPNRSGNGFRTHLRGHAGMPDYVACRNGRLLFVELKSQRGRLSAAQRVWRSELQKTSAEYHLVHPSDLDHFLKRISLKGNS